MNHRHFLAAFGACSLLLAGACDKGASPGAASTEVVATVNGTDIPKSQFDQQLADIARQSGREVSPEQRGQLLDQLIDMQLLAEAGEKAGIAKEQTVADQIAVARLKVIADASARKYIDDHPVTDAELRPEYDAQVAAIPREYHARHILVEDKATADAVIADLKGGADFAKLASEKSKDSSAKNGGDLGWFPLDRMVKPFSDAVAALQPGQTTDQAVQSQFGWHVIKLEDSRTQPAPAFEDVKDRVEAILRSKRLQTYLDELRKNAKIEKKI
jgi:peptidyl-prolyl cis-trans isomerase C